MHIERLHRVKQEDGTIILCGTCVITGEMYYTKPVYFKDIVKYRAGMKVKDAFPYLSADDREFIISGTSPKGWSRIFGTQND